MKKQISIVVAVGIAIIIAVVLFHPETNKRIFTPKSERLYQQYYEHLKTLNTRRWTEEPSYSTDYTEKAEKLLDQAIDAAMEDKNIDMATYLIESKIKQLGKPQYKYGMTFPVSKPQIILQAIYYERLALVHSWNKGQNVSVEQEALKKAKNLRARASRMK